MLTDGNKLNVDAVLFDLDGTLIDSIGRGRQGESLIDGMIDYLSSQSDEVHAIYHNYVTMAAYGQHTRFAEQALAEAAVCE